MPGARPSAARLVSGHRVRVLRGTGMLFSLAAAVLALALAAALFGWSALATAAVGVAWFLVAGGAALFLAGMEP